MSRKRPRKRKAAEVPDKITPEAVEARRATVEAQAARGDWLAEYVSRCAKALNVSFDSKG